jgi:hypothetical protein
MRFSSVAALLAVASTASAELYLTSPVGSTSCQAGQPCNIAWSDDGNTPNLESIGLCDLGLFVGSVAQQVQVQHISDGIDVSKNAQLAFTPEANGGGSGSFYFIRFTSKTLASTANPQYPYQSFSAKFTITGMTGTFNSTVQSMIDGATVSPGASTSASQSPATSAGSSSAAVTTKPASGSAASTGAASATRAAGSATASSAASLTFVPASGSIVGAGIMSVVGLVLGAAFGF